MSGILKYRKEGWRIKTKLGVIDIKNINLLIKKHSAFFRFFSAPWHNVHEKATYYVSIFTHSRQIHQLYYLFFNKTIMLHESGQIYIDRLLSYENC